MVGGWCFNSRLMPRACSMLHVQGSRPCSACAGLFVMGIFRADAQAGIEYWIECLKNVPTSGVDDEAAGVSAHKEAPAFHAQPCDLALLQHILQTAEVLYAPHERGLVAVCCVCAQSFASCFCLWACYPSGCLHSIHLVNVPPWFHLSVRGTTVLLPSSDLQRLRLFCIHSMSGRSLIQA